MDKARWQQLSPQLDELLELDVAARREHLDQLRAADPGCAAELEELLTNLTAVDRSGFLDTAAPLLVAGMAGQLVGPYQLERELGAGGMGTVWLAKRMDGSYQGQVAIKFLSLGLLSRGGAQRFAREGQILARLTHPNIARLIDAGVLYSRHPYLVLEYVDGEQIDRHCDRNQLDTRARLMLFLDVLAAVAHAHTRLILHRDLKPGNILVTAAGEVKLLDFGIAKLLEADAPAQATELTQQSGRPFTAAYAAPEQVTGTDLTTATDVYALGVLLYVLLSGVHPTASSDSTPLEQLRALVDVPPKRLSSHLHTSPASDAANPQPRRELNVELDSILAKALQKSAAERYANAAAFADDVRRYLNDEPLAARPDTLGYRALKFMRRHRLGVAATLAIVVTLAAGIAATLWQAREVRTQQAKAEDLIEFMLGELRGKLQPVGRLDVLSGVGEKALAYYDGQATRLLDDAALGRRARALHLIGELAELRGDLDQAAAVLERAAASTRSLIQRNPRDGQLLFDHAQSAYWVGYVAWRRGLLEQARADFTDYLRLSRQLQQLDASNLDWRVEEGHAHQNLGVVLLDEGKLADALTELDLARVRFTESLPQRPVLLETLISNRGWAAKVTEAQGNLGGAIAAITAQLEAERSRADAGNNRDAQLAMAVAESELARLELWRGAAAVARQHAQTAVRVLRSLVLADPDNVLWAQELAWAHVKSADAEVALGELIPARTSLAAAKSAIAALLAKDPQIANQQLSLIGRNLVANYELAVQSRTEPAQQELAQWLQSTSAQSLSRRRRYVLGLAHLLLGDTYAGAGKRTASEAQWRSGTQLLEPLAVDAGPMAQAILAQLQLRLGDRDAARTLARQIGATDFRHPVYRDLLQRLSAGN